MDHSEMTPSAVCPKCIVDVTGDGSVSMFGSTNQSAEKPGTSESVRKSACIQFEKEKQHQVWNVFMFILSISFYERYGFPLNGDFIMKSYIKQYSFNLNDT